MHSKKNKKTIFNAIRKLTSPKRMVLVLIINPLKKGQASFMLYHQNRHRANQLKLKREIETIQQEMINKQLNAHFTLKSEDSFSEKKLNGGRIEAYDMVNSFSNLMKSGILFSDCINWSLGEELAFTKKYLDLMKTRYNSLFGFNMQIAKSVDSKNLLVPRLIIQNCTESVIKKAYEQEKTKKNMEINCAQTSEAVEITNTINMGAVDKNEKKGSRFLDKNSKCMMLNTKQIEFYNRLYNTDISLEVIDTLNPESESIIQVRLIIPYTY